MILFSKRIEKLIMMPKSIQLFLDIIGPNGNEIEIFPLLKMLCQTDSRLSSCQIRFDYSGWRTLEQDGKNGSCSIILEIYQHELNDFNVICREKGYLVIEKQQLAILRRGIPIRWEPERVSSC